MASICVVRSRCRWAEEGETSSASFLSLEKKHRAKKSITSIHDPDSGLIHHDPFEILGTWQRYYARLFTADRCDMVAQDAILSNLCRSLSLAEVESCEGLLSIPECKQALDGMSKGKTPGSDGFPMELFSSFWDVLGADLVRILNCAFDCGKLSTSQLRGLIIVLYKKDDRLETKNYRRSVFSMLTTRLPPGLSRVVFWVLSVRSLDPIRRVAFLVVPSLKILA